MKIIDISNKVLLVRNFGSGAPSGIQNLLLSGSEPNPSLQFRSGGTTFAQLSGEPAGKLVLATGARSWRFESNGNLTPGTADTDYSIGGASVPLMLRGSTLELQGGSNVGVRVEGDATVKLGSSGVCTGTAVRLQDNYFEKEWEFNFPAGSVGKFCDLHFAPVGSLGFAGLIEISVTGSWYGENASGSVIKRFQVGLRNGVGEQSNRYVSAPSYTAKNFAISDFSWDAVNSRWRVKIVHLRDTQNWVVIRVKAQSGSAFNSIDPLLGIAMSYPTETETLPQEPVVSYDTPVSFFGSAGAPTAGTRSPGTRAVMNASLCSGLVDYAVGYESDAMWFSVSDTVKSFKWYGNTTPMMKLTGGILRLGSLGTNQRSVLEFYRDGLSSSLTGCVGFDAAGPGTNLFLANTSATGAIVLSACSRAWAAMPTGEFMPAAAGTDYAIGRDSSGFRVANYWGVNGNYSGNLLASGNLTVGGTLGVTGAVTLNGDLTVGGQIVSTVASPVAPFSVLSTTKVNNLTAHYLGQAGQDADYFRSPSNLSGLVPLHKGGTNTDLSGAGIYSLIYANQAGGVGTVAPNTSTDPMFLRGVGNGTAATGLCFAPVPGVVPVGGIVAWSATVNDPAPAGWVKCNGGGYPDLNGTGSEPKRFLRGACTSGGTGGGTHSHVVSSTSTSLSAVSPGGATVIADVTTPTGATEALPPYYEVVWIMRVS